MHVSLAVNGAPTGTRLMVVVTVVGMNEYDVVVMVAVAVRVMAFPRRLLNEIESSSIGFIDGMMSGV